MSLRVTILLRIEEGNKQTTGCEMAPRHRHRHKHWPCGMTQGHKGAGEKGMSQELELPRPCSLERGQTRGLFWFPKHMDCLVSSLKYCGLTDMALTIGNGQEDTCLL